MAKLVRALVILSLFFIPQEAFGARTECGALTVKGYRIVHDTGAENSDLNVRSVDIVGTAVNTRGDTLELGQVAFMLYSETQPIGRSFDLEVDIPPHSAWKFRAVTFEENVTRAKLKGVLCHNVKIESIR